MFLVIVVTVVVAISLKSNEIARECSENDYFIFSANIRSPEKLYEGFYGKVKVCH